MSRAGAFWDHEAIRGALGGTWLARPEPPPALTGGASIDTRTLLPGQTFFALRGERTDGHSFLAAAGAAGSALAVIDDADRAGPLPSGLPVLRVPDARRALGRLAAAYRDFLSSTRFIGVTGSNGKTTTTRMIHACLSAGLRGRCSARSFNNDLGVPLTILGAEPDDRYVVCEVGMNAPGEIEPLSAVVRPHVVVITSIGSAHLEAMGSLEAIAAEKASLAAHLAPGGLVVATADAPTLRPWIKRFEAVVTFGEAADADLRVGDVREDASGVSFTINGRDRFSLPVLGAHNALNAAAAIAVARRLGGDERVACRALAAVAPAEMRLARERVAGISVINDAYNANPDSVAAALRTLARVAPSGSRRVAILGDMLEMGPAGPGAHGSIGEYLAASALADLVVLVGPLAAHAARPLERAGIETVAVESLESGGAERVAALLREGDTVLLKGSRGVRLERVLAALRAGASAGV